MNHLKNIFFYYSLLWHAELSFANWVEGVKVLNKFKSLIVIEIAAASIIFGKDHRQNSKGHSEYASPLSQIL